MKYLSVCSGIEAATVAWHPLGWRAAAFAEIEKFPSAVLAHRWPETPNLGDLTKFQTWPNYAIDLLVGGTPCQSFSVAGLRKGLADPRGNLTLTYLALAARYRPRWLVWENVPGVLSDKTGAFGALLGGLAELGYGFAYRVLDAQFFGVAQRRRRVFVVGHLGDWRRAAAVLFERASLCGHPAPRREAGQRAAGTLSARTEGGGGLGTDFDLAGGVVEAIRTPQGGFFDEVNGGGIPQVAGCLQERDAKGCDSDTKPGHLIPILRGGFFDDVAHTLKGEGLDASEDGTGRGTPLAPVHAIQAGALRENPNSGPDGVGVQANIAYTLEARAEVQAVAFDTTQITSKANRCRPVVGDPCHPLAAGAHPPAIAFSRKDHGADAGDISPTLRSMGHDGSHANGGGQVAVAAFGPFRYGGSNQDTLHCERGILNTLPVGAHGNTGHFTKTVIGAAVRRLTPMECERLQGFPDGYTAIPGAKDGPRYKALGNSMAVPVMAWIGHRIALVDALPFEPQPEMARMATEPAEAPESTPSLPFEDSATPPLTPPPLC